MMIGHQPQHPYEKKIEEASQAGIPHVDGLINFTRQRAAAKSRFLYATLSGQTQHASIESFIAQANADIDAGNIAVCVVENINPSVLAELGNTWNIDPAFFASHIYNPEPASLWQVHTWEPPTADSFPPFERLVGTYAYHGGNPDIHAYQEHSGNNCIRYTADAGEYPAYCTSNISYTLVSRSLYLFLVDPPPYYRPISSSTLPSQPPIFRLPCAQNHGGLILPSFDCQQPFVPFEALQSILKHKWIMKRLFQTSGPFPKTVLMYLASYSLQFRNFLEIERRITQISFHEIRNPNFSITRSLHDLRKELSDLQYAIAATEAFIPPEVDAYYAELHRQKPLHSMTTPSEAHRKMFLRSERLHQFLLDTFQLLMNTMLVRDGQLSVQIAEMTARQTNQGILLTRLATVYLPFSLATSVFGMNLKQLNENGQSIWVFIVTCVVILVMTLAILQVQVPLIRVSNWVEFQNVKSAWEEKAYKTTGNKFYSRRNTFGA